MTAPSQKRGTTLDFTLVDQRKGKKFIAEMKCWLEYEGYKYLRLTSAKQLEGLKNTAFLRFLEMAVSPNTYGVSVAGKPTRVDGTILIWGSASEDGRNNVMEKYGIAAVLTVEEMLKDLKGLSTKAWIEFIEELREWSNGLFDFLTQNPR